jgi:hypothetical protein
MDINDIKPYDKNAKKHPDSQLQALAKIVADVGWRVPIIINHKTNVIVNGHGRFLCYLQYKDQYNLKMIWVTNDLGETVLGEQEKTPMTEKQEKMFRLADNKVSQTDFDEELLYEEVKELYELDEELGKLSGYEISDFDYESFEEKNKEIDVDEIEGDLNIECPKCGFKFKK